eukprot:TRINITY_DN1777_c0_g1_i1.p1 TRINITY_DN1777_c0_g1~~TRINITY_DN1777_c0_g1_i1.p1  ORF type:complete len:115 (+),score=43.58 TRINITY_DN1777_c0_g1_i1:19-363(+)
MEGKEEEDDYVEVEEEITEELFLTLELNEYKGTDWVSSCQTYSIIGLETPKPMLQLDEDLFEGTYEETVGTHLLFDYANITPENKNHLKPTAMTNKKIVFKKVRIANEESTNES